MWGFLLSALVATLVSAQSTAPACVFHADSAASVFNTSFPSNRCPPANFLRLVAEQKRSFLTGGRLLCYVIWVSFPDRLGIYNEAVRNMTAAFSDAERVANETFSFDKIRRYNGRVFEMRQARNRMAQESAALVTMMEGALNMTECAGSCRNVTSDMWLIARQARSQVMPETSLDGSVAGAAIALYGALAVATVIVLLVLLPYFETLLVYAVVLALALTCCILNISWLR
jgi:hypothetical protein